MSDKPLQVVPDDDWVAEVSEKYAALTFCDGLADWEDLDWASFLLARSLGLFLSEDFLDIKWVFVTENILSSALDRILATLVESSILEFRDEPDGPQYRWHVKGNGHYLTGVR